MAIISNISPYFEDMHTCTAQRLVFLIHALTNKYKRLITRNAPQEEIDTYLKFLQMCVETINCCLTYALRKNLRLIYELLYKRSVITALKKLCILPQAVANIEIVVQFFAQQLRAAETQGVTVSDLEDVKTPYDVDFDAMDTPKFNVEAEDKFFARKRNISLDQDIDIEDEEFEDYGHGKKSWTVEEVMEILDRGMKLWSSNAKEQRFKIFKHLPFMYTEDANTEA